MLAVYEAYKIMLDSTTPTTKKELIPIENSKNRVLAKDILATFDMPRFDNSAMDGYGIKLLDTGKQVKLLHKELAGDKNYSISEGECIKIMTGAKVDSSIEAIVPIELVEVNGDMITIPNDVKENANIRKQGEEFKKGSVLLENGKF